MSAIQNTTKQPMKILRIGDQVKVRWGGQWMDALITDTKYSLGSVNYATTVVSWCEQIESMESVDPEDYNAFVFFVADATNETIMKVLRR